MWKETVRALQTGAMAEIAVIAFFVAFVLVVVYAFTLSKRQRDRAKNLPLDDAPEVYADGTPAGDVHAGDGAPAPPDRP